MLSSYRELLGDRHCRRIALASAMGRLPVGMVPLALILLVHHHTGSFATAGIAASALAVGAAVGWPAQGRLIDRHGQREVLTPLAVLCGLACAAMWLAAGQDAPAFVLVVLAALIGASEPPLAQAMRAYWDDRQDEPRLRAAGQAFESLTLKVAYLAGPLVVSLLLAAGVGHGSLFALMGGWFFAGTIGYAHFRYQDPDAPVLSFPAAPRHSPSALLSGELRWAMLGALATGWAVGGMELALPAFSQELGNVKAAGPLFSAVTLGAVLGALIYGARPCATELRRMMGLSCVAYGFVLVPLAFASTFAGMALGLLLAGGANAWLGTCINERIVQLASKETRMEALSWFFSAVTVGIACAQALNSFLLDRVGAAGLFLSGAVPLLALGLLLLATSRKALPAS